MKFKITKPLLALTVGAGMIVGALPANAATGVINVNVAGATCQYLATNPPKKSVATNLTCHLVSTRIQYISAGGTKSYTSWKNDEFFSESATPSGVDYFSGETRASILQGVNERWSSNNVLSAP